MCPRCLKSPPWFFASAPVPRVMSEAAGNGEDAMRRRLVSAGTTGPSLTGGLFGDRWDTRRENWGISFLKHGSQYVSGGNVIWGDSREVSMWYAG